MIPRNIFQTFKTSELPPELSENLSKNLQQASGWSHRLFDDQMILEYIRLHYGQSMVRRYERISPMYGAARADLFRYLVLYQEGGVYLDIKSVMTKSLSEVIRCDDSYLLGNWCDCGELEYASYGRDATIANPEGEFQQWFIVSEAKHPFLEAVIHEVCGRIDSYSPRFSGIGRWGTLNTTGPVPYTNAIYRIINLHKHRRVRSFSDLGFRYSMFDMPSQHYEVMPTHYSKNRGPVVIHPGHIHARNLMRSGAAAIGRRLAKLI